MGEQIPSDKVKLIDDLRTKINRAIERGDDEFAGKCEDQLIALEKGLTPTPETAESRAIPVESNKIYNFRDVEGNPNFEILDFYRELNSSLEKKFQAYIGLIPFGSMSRGYATSGSDIDVRFLYDKDEGDAEECRFYLENKFVREFNEQNDVKIHVLARGISRQSIEDVFSTVKAGTISRSETQLLSLVSELVVGERAMRYRNMIQQKMKELPFSQIEVWIQSAVSAAVQGEQYSLGKIETRAADSFDERQFIKQRRQLHEARMKRLWFHR